MDGIGKALSALDFHPKTVKDFVVRTKTGAAVSLFALVVAMVLFVAELQWYLAVEVVEHMEVDNTARGSKMRVNFDVVFPSLPCAVVSVDAVDASGQHQLEILHDVFKRRIDPDGVAIGVSAKDGRNTLKSQEQLLKEKQRAIAEGRASEPAVAAGGAVCGDCFGAGEAGQCCNSCEDVRNAYRKKGWQFNMDGIETCKKEGFYGDVNAQVQAKEGCNVYGHLEVPKVAGNLHFAPAHTIQHAYTQVQDLVAFTVNTFNISHRVNALSFGPYFEGAHYPLDGRERMLEAGAGTGMHQYFVKLVPTVFTALGARQPVHTYQFSVTEHLRRIEAKTAALETMQGVLPGVYFNYELSPLRVRIEERRRSLGHLLTRVSAIIGGVFVVMGLVDALLYRLLENVARGRRRGEAFGGHLSRD